MPIQNNHHVKQLNVLGHMLATLGNLLLTKVHFCFVNVTRHQTHICKWVINETNMYKKRLKEKKKASHSARLQLKSVLWLFRFHSTSLISENSYLHGKWSVHQWFMNGQREFEDRLVCVTISWNCLLKEPYVSNWNAQLIQEKGALTLVFVTFILFKWFILFTGILYLHFPQRNMLRAQFLEKKKTVFNMLALNMSSHACRL